MQKTSKTLRVSVFPCIRVSQNYSMMSGFNIIALRASQKSKAPRPRVADRRKGTLGKTVKSQKFTNHRLEHLPMS